MRTTSAPVSWRVSMSRQSDVFSAFSDHGI
jgi:hypothetical protein